MNRSELFEKIQTKKSFLCIGLDTDINKIPIHLKTSDDPVFEFNQQIIEATHDLCVAYKPNLAFYESLGAKGWNSLVKTIKKIPAGCFTIADAKRGDIGNTSALYARTFFDSTFSGLEFDAVTVAPYMGQDSVTPFLNYPGKWVIMLALTSNKGSADIQQLTDAATGAAVYKTILKKSCEWAGPDQLMYVVGATHPNAFREIRELVPEHFLLVPGVGAQGGDLEQVAINGFNQQIGLLVNASRSIIYASPGEDFAERAREEAMKLQKEMEILMDKYL
jgi:orotidine-5'-phosphate decarboxylase